MSESEVEQCVTKIIQETGAVSIKDIGKSYACGDENPSWESGREIDSRNRQAKIEFFHSFKGRGDRMNLVDLVLAIVLIFFMLLGYRDGFIRKAAAMLAVVLGLIVATKNMYLVGKILKSTGRFGETASLILAFMILFLAVMAAEVIIMFFLRKDKKATNIFDKMGGAVLGTVEGGLFLSLALILLGLYNLPKQSMRNDSLLYNPVKIFSPQLFDLTNQIFPGSRGFYDEIQKSLEKFHITGSQ